MKPPAFQFYPSDFLASTSEMTAEEVGVHIRLLCHQWIKGGLPNDDARLMAMAGQCQASSLAYAKSRFGICEDGAIRHTRLERERSKQEAYREKQAQNGAKRWVGNAKPHAKPKAVATPSQLPNACSPSPSPSSIGITQGILPTAVGEEAKAKPRERKPNPLFDALAELDQGANGENLTKRAARAVGVALSEIRMASPDVTPEEIRKRAGNLALHFPGCTTTASSLAKHWSRCTTAPAPRVNGHAANPDLLTTDQYNGVVKLLREKSARVHSAHPDSLAQLQEEIFDLEAKKAKHEAATQDQEFDQYIHA